MKMNTFFWVILFYLGLAIATPCYAGNFEWDLFGISYQFSNMFLIPDQKPRKLDSGGHTVWNPGLGIGYDYRPSVNTEGTFPLFKAGFFQSNQDSTVSYIAIAQRWRFCASSGVYGDISWGISVMLRQVYYYDENDHLVEQVQRIVPLPLLNLGIGTRVLDKYTQLNFTAVNPLSGMLLFMTREL